LTDKLNESGLKELFGRAIVARLVKTGLTRPSKHRRPACCHTYFHPAGTKLVRRFIRRARGEQTEYRRIYAALTGHQLP
jgi:hypothetical protein